MKRVLWILLFAFLIALPLQSAMLHPQPIADTPPASSYQDEDITLIVVVDESLEPADWLVLVVSRNRLMGVFSLRQLPTGLFHKFYLDKDGNVKWKWVDWNSKFKNPLPPGKKWSAKFLAGRKRAILQRAKRQMKAPTEVYVPRYVTGEKDAWDKHQFAEMEKKKRTEIPKKTVAQLSLEKKGIPIVFLPQGYWEAAWMGKNKEIIRRINPRVNVFEVDFRQGSGSVTATLAPAAGVYPTGAKNALLLCLDFTASKDIGNDQIWVEIVDNPAIKSQGRVPQKAAKNNNIKLVTDETGRVFPFKEGASSIEKRFSLGSQTKFNGAVMDKTGRVTVAFNSDLYSAMKKQVKKGGGYSVTFNVYMWQYPNRESGPKEVKKLWNEHWDYRIKRDIDRPKEDAKKVLIHRQTINF